MENITNILLVDDEPQIIETLTRYLTLEGYSILSANNALEGLESIYHARRTWFDEAPSKGALLLGKPLKELFS